MIPQFPGALYFTTYHFRGDVPQTDWQGIRATVIRQGWYITIPELQLYYERSKNFRATTATQEKMIRLERALFKKKSRCSRVYRSARLLILHNIEKVLLATNNVVTRFCDF